MFDFLQSHGLQHARLLYHPLSPGVCSNSCPLNQRCYLIILSSAIPYSFCLHFFPASGSFPMNQLFASGGQSVGASASVLLKNIHGWFPLELTGLISFQSKGLKRLLQHHFFNSSIISSSALSLLYGPKSLCTLIAAMKLRDLLLGRKAGRGRGRLIFVKYSQCVLHSKCQVSGV